MTREMSREMFFTFREMYPTFISRNVKNISRLKKYCLPFILNNLRFRLDFVLIYVSQATLALSALLGWSGEF